ncbi:MAG: substrate-binding domain-containing protein, partial [Planctomycetaceae bacterium]
ADWGIGIAPVADMYGLGFLPIQPEQYDLVIPLQRNQRPAVQALRALLDDPSIRDHLGSLGFQPAN